MSLVLYNTNILISLFIGREDTILTLEKIGAENTLIPSITVMELFRGMQNKKELSEMNKKLIHYNILHFNEEVSILAIELIHKFKLSNNLSIPDAIIAAMSVVYNIPLFTYNIKDFNFIPNLILYK